MRKVVLTLMIALWIMPGLSLAHSVVEEAVPGKDAVLTESPASIALTFNTDIEKISTLKLLRSNGEEAKLQPSAVKDATLSAEVADTLDNGKYTVKYAIIGADGHTVDGEYTFTVNAPAAPASPSPSPSPSAEPQGSIQPSPTIAPEQDNQQPDSEPAESSTSNKTALLVIGGLIAAAVVVLFILRGRRKNG
ncbi:copper resistance protein CopC [Paenibacillus sp. GCM10023252]|uniref:copper resistance CopC family protein n=1 Tax=Paenibacillus sp. GCM10023252 TaxID=3252649 RepID=UPI003619BDD5